MALIKINMERKRVILAVFVVVFIIVIYTVADWNRIMEVNLDHTFWTQNHSTLHHEQQNLENTLGPQIRSALGSKETADLNLKHIKFWENEQVCENALLSNDLIMTSEAYSTFNLIHFDKESGLTKVIIVAKSWKNVPKKVGGDLFLLWAEQVKGDGRSAGIVTDNKNGTYTGEVRIYWSGNTSIKLKLGATLENYCRRRRAMIKYGNSVFALSKPWGIQGVFKRNAASENTRCAIGDRIRGYVQTCNFTSLNDESPWFCGKPKHPNLSCNDIFEFNQGLFPKIASDSYQNSSEVISKPGRGELKHNVTFNSKIKNGLLSLDCRRRSKRDSWFTSGGFFLNGTWSYPLCHNKMVFDIQAYKRCLKNKTVACLGDSTVRQYASYFLSEIKSIPLVNLKNLASKNRMYHPTAEFTGEGIRIIYKKHELPFYHPHVPPNGITSLAREIDALSQSKIPGKNLIVLINYNSHLQAFPPDKIRMRLQRIARSLETLMQVKPETRIFLKGPHVHSGGHNLGLRAALVEMDIIFQEFNHLIDKIIYLDVWSISVAFNNELLHPGKSALSSQIQQLMSYIC